MNRTRALFLAMILSAACQASRAQAQGPEGKDFGFGLVLGEPTGLSVKYWLNNRNALAGSLGASYFGAPRLGVDYLWHFNPFSSAVVKMYAGPGLAIGFGDRGTGFWYREGNGNHWFYRNGTSAGVAVRAVFGLNIIPRRTPLEIFLEAGPLIGLSPSFGTAIDAALGVRFYP